MIQTSPEIGEIAGACAKAQAELENVSKDGTNPHFRSKYATLAAVLDEIRPKFAKHGVQIYQAPINGEGPNIGVVTRLMHSSGQWIESTLYVAPSKFDAQGAGSVITYLRRYALMAVAAISADDDDDGNAAVARPESRPIRQPVAYEWTAPPKPEPPHHPETGELTPHPIGGWGSNAGFANVIEWGSKFIAAIKNTKTQAEIEEWRAINSAALGDMMANYPKAWRSVDAAVSQQWVKLGPDEPELLGADETEGVLR